MVASDDIEVRSLQAIRNEQTKTIFSKYGVSISFSEQGVLKIKGDEQSLDVFEPQPLKAKYVLLSMVPQSCDNTDAINSNGRFLYVLQLVEQDGAEASLVRGFEIVLDKYESAQSLFDLLDKWKSKKGKENVSYCIAAVKYPFDIIWTQVLAKWTRAESRVAGNFLPLLTDENGFQDSIVVNATELDFRKLSSQRFISKEQIERLQTMPVPLPEEPKPDDPIIKPIEKKKVFVRTCPLPKPTGMYTDVDDSLISSWMDVNHMAEDASKRFDEFKGIMPEGTHFTQLVLIGTQSSGKSTLLEYFCRTRCSYAVAGLGTTRPIVYHVERDSKAQAQQIRLAPDKPEVSSDELIQYLEQSQRDGKIRSEPIHVYMRSSSAFTITMVDLPGIIGVVEGASTEAREHARNIENLALDYMRNPSTLIVAVRNGQDDWEVPNSRSAEKLIAKADPDFYRTVVVTTRVLGSPGLAARNAAYFQGLGKEGQSFPKAPKFFVDVALQKGSPTPIQFPTDPSQVPGIMEGLEKSLRDALLQNPQSNDVSSLLQHTLGFTSCTSYIRSLFVKSDKDMVGEINHRLQKLKAPVLKKLNQMKTLSPPEDFYERVQLLDTCIQLYCALFSSHMKESVKTYVGKTSKQEHQCVKWAFENLGIEQGSLGDAVKGNSKDAQKENGDVFMWYEEEVDSIKYSFRWTETEMKLEGEGDQQKYGGAAMNRVFREAKIGLQEFSNRTEGNVRIPQFESIIGVSDIGAERQRIHPTGLLPTQLVLHAKSVAGIFKNIFGYFSRRAYVILTDLGKSHAFSILDADIKDYQALPYFEAAKVALENSAPIRELLFQWFCQYIRLKHEQNAPIQDYVLEAKLLQFNSDFDTYKTSHEAKMKENEGIRDVDQCVKVATVQYANELVKEGFRKFFPDFVAMFHIMFVKSFVKADSSGVGVTFKKFLHDFKKDSLAVNNLFSGNDEVWSAINILERYKKEIEAMEAKLRAFPL